MTKKWYNFFISTGTGDGAAGQQSGAGQQTGNAGDKSGSAGRQSGSAGRQSGSAGRQSGQAAGAGGRPGGKGAIDAAQTVADIVAQLGEPTVPQSAPGSRPVSFEEIYAAAEIQPPSHGYTIFKVGEMLQSEHIRNLPAGVKKSSILVALEASGVNVREIIEDAVKRDRALDVYERVREQSLADLEQKKTAENQRIQEELDRIAAEHRARIQANSDEIARIREEFRSWRLLKQQEEQRIFESVSYFVTENPISTGSSPAGPSPERS